MKNAKVPLVGFAAWSGTGKTTLLKRLIPILRTRGLKVGLVKHAHHTFDIDHPGKDSYELRQAGASPVMIVSSKRRAIIYECDPPQEPSLDDHLAYLDQSGLDLLLIEGFKRAPIPKIELHRKALSKPLLFPEDRYIVAVASDEPIEDCPLPQLSLNHPEEVADFIVREIVDAQARRGP